MKKFHVVHFRTACTVDAVAEALVNVMKESIKSEVGQIGFRLVLSPDGKAAVASNHPEYGPLIFQVSLAELFSEFHLRGWSDAGMLQVIQETQRCLAQLKKHYRKHKDKKSPKV